MRSAQDNNIWRFEEDLRSKGHVLIAGIDEAGRGPLAGPVVSAAVILPENFEAQGITDSKKLTPKKRDHLFEYIMEKALHVGIGISDHTEIDATNILRASLFSMLKSVKNLGASPDFLLIDGIFKIDSGIPQLPIKKGDSLSISIASASIIAKVTRDRLMDEYDSIYPEFGFKAHKGYPTAAHREAIAKHGVSPIHRKTFKGVKEWV